ncbi:hypothetical protein V1291_001213 [Nitrobacteraceae bacterium AZCC 1564]
MIAVTPDATVASSAWPTLTPAMSVSRFFIGKPPSVVVQKFAPFFPRVLPTNF